MCQFPVHERDEQGTAQPVNINYYHLTHPFTKIFDAVSNDIRKKKFEEHTEQNIDVYFVHRKRNDRVPNDSFMSSLTFGGDNGGG